eukprot:gene31566-38993_t
MNLLQRTGSKTDAVAVMVKSDIFETLGSENVYLCSLNDRVALMLWLRHKTTGKDILVANTHLSFPHNASDRRNQMCQMEILTKFIDQFAQRHGIESATRIVLGDFNVEGHSPVCNHLRASGFYSCFEVCPPSNRGLTPIPANPDDNDTTRSDDITTTDNLNAATLSALHLSPDAAVCGRTGQHIVTHHSDAEAEQENLEEPDDSPLDVDAASDEVKVTSEPISADRRPSAVAPLHHHQYSSVTASDFFVSHHTHKEEDLGVDHIFVRPELLYASEAAEKSGQLKEGVFVSASQVLPSGLSCNEWPLDFASISDHRPVQATIVFGRAVSGN